MSEFEQLRQRVVADRFEYRDESARAYETLVGTANKYNMVSSILENVLCMLAATPDHPANAQIREYIDAELSRL